MESQPDLFIPKQLGNAHRYSGREKFFLGVICVLFLVFYIPTISRSLWIDETVTYWVVKDGFWDVIHRAVHFQGQSPFYFLLTWCFIKLLGQAEWVLRLPSLLSLMLACAFLYRLSLTFFDREWALISVLSLISLWQLIGAGLSARPYALAVMCSLLSVLCFIKWIQTDRVKYQIAYVTGSVAACFAHILFTPILFIHLCYFLINREKDSKVSFRKLILTFGVIAVCLSPNAYQLKLLIEKRGLLSYAPMPSVKDLLHAWIPLELFVPLTAGFLIARIVEKKTGWGCTAILSKRLYFVLIWFFFPAFILFVASKMNGSSIFLYRYYCWSSPAVAIVIGGIVKALEPCRSRYIAVAGFSVVLILCSILHPKPIVDWRNAVTYINSANIGEKEPILVWPGLVEARDVKWLTDQEKRDYLLAPFSYYTLKSKAVLLPWKPNGLDLETFLSKHNTALVKQRDELCLIVRNILQVKERPKQKFRTIQDILEDWLRAHGFLLIQQKSFGGIIVSRFAYSIDE